MLQKLQEGRHEHASSEDFTKREGKRSRDDLCVVADGGHPADTQDWLPTYCGAGRGSCDNGPSMCVSPMSAVNQERASEHVLGGSTRRA